MVIRNPYHLLFRIPLSQCQFRQCKELPQILSNLPENIFDVALGFGYMIFSVCVFFFFFFGKVSTLRAPLLFGYFNFHVFNNPIL